MNEREALVAEIRATPDNDAPRLVAADWFEEQGTPSDIGRADFIRTQIARANLPTNDPVQCELQAKELRLLREFGEDWCGSHFAFKKSVFRRGFIEYVHLHLQQFQHHRRQLMRLEPVRDIRFTGWWRSPQSLIERVARCEELQHVETLRFHNQGPHKWPDGRTLPLLESPHLTSLRNLDCTWMDFDAVNRRRFETLDVLKRIETLRLPVLNFDAGNWFSERPELVHQLSKLRSVQIGSYSTRLLATLKEQRAWQNLKSLSVSFTGWDHDEILPLRDWMPTSLETVNLMLGDPDNIDDGNRNQVAEVCSRIEELSVTELQLSAASLTPDGLSGVLENCSGLKSLKLADTPLTSSHGEVIAQCENLKSLHTLDISRCNRQDESLMQEILRSPNLAGVAQLVVKGCLIGQHALHALTKSAGAYRIVDAFGCFSDAETAEQFVQSHVLRNATWLSVGVRRSVNGDANSMSGLCFRQLPNLSALYLWRPLADVPKIAWLWAEDEKSWKPIASTTWPQVEESLEFDFGADDW